jgi:RNA polymerase sigma-B factor
MAELMPLAMGLARRYARSSEPREDLSQVACLGLLKAIDRFDPTRRTSFAAFAVPTILGELRRYFRDATWPVHVPRSAQERSQAIEASVERLTSSHGRTPTVEQIAEDVGMSVHEVLDGLLVRRAYDTEPLEARGGDGEEELHPATIDKLGTIDRGYKLVDESATVIPVLGQLSDRERHVLQLRFISEMSQSEIAACIGVSQMQVSRILASSLNRIRELVGSPTAA